MTVEIATYQIEVSGRDISSVVFPILQDLSVQLTSGGSSDSATLTIDDRGSQVKLPPPDSDITIRLGYSGRGVTEVFRGKVNDIKSKRDRGGGQSLTFTCSGIATNGKAKQQRDKHYDNKKVKDILSDAGKAAGIGDVSVDSEIGDVVIPYFLQADESFLHLGQRLSRMFGGTFKIAGSKAVMVKRGASRSASGKPLKSITATPGVNLIDWDVTPIIGRPRHKKVDTKWYDKTEAKWKTETKDTEDKDAVATGRPRFSAGSQAEAKGRSGSGAEESDRNKGDGTITINGDPMCQPEAKCLLAGTRPGVDGSYIIDAVSHNVSRGGFTTSLTLKRPGDGAGKDSR